MSPKLKAFLKKHGRFPKRGEGRKRSSRRRASTRSVRHTARRRGRRGRRGSTKLPIITLAILASQIALAYKTGGDNAARIANFVSYYTGFHPTGLVGGSVVWNPANLLIGYGPWVVKRFAIGFARPRIGVRGLPVTFS